MSDTFIVSILAFIVSMIPIVTIIVKLNVTLTKLNVTIDVLSKQMEVFEKNKDDMISQLNELYYLQSYNDTTNIDVTGNLPMRITASAIKGA